MNSTNLYEEEVYSESWQVSSQLDVLDFGVQLSETLELLVLGQDFLLNLLCLHISLGQKLFEAVTVAARRRKTKIKESQRQSRYIEITNGCVCATPTLAGQTSVAR